MDMGMAVGSRYRRATLRGGRFFSCATSWNCNMFETNLGATLQKTRTAFLKQHHVM